MKFQTKNPLTFTEIKPLNLNVMMMSWNFGATITQEGELAVMKESSGLIAATARKPAAEWADELDSHIAAMVASAGKPRRQTIDERLGREPISQMAEDLGRPFG